MDDWLIGRNKLAKRACSPLESSAEALKPEHEMATTDGTSSSVEIRQIFDRREITRGALVKLR